MPLDKVERPRVALCLAGALRDFVHTWPSIRRNIIEPTGAATFVVTSAQRNAAAGSKVHAAADHQMNLTELIAFMGKPLRAAAIWNDEDLTPANIATWAGQAAANSADPALHGNVYSWQYFLKRWACLGLVAAHSHEYDVVVTMRPDLFVFQPWRVDFQPHGSSHHRESHARGAIATHSRAIAITTSNDSTVVFGEDELVMHDFTFSCTNDWIAVSTLRTAITLEQTIHHLYSARGFSHCSGGVSMCCETLFSAYLWRVGLARNRTNLHVEMARKVGPLPADTWATPDRALINERSKCRRNEHNWAGLWNAYCTDAAFDAFGDQVVLQDDGTVGYTFPAHSRLPRGPGVSVPLGNATCKGSNVSIHPPCADVVDLQQPLVPCTRRSIGQRVRATGHGQPYPWWQTCGAGCKPVPNTFFISGDGSATPATVYPGRPQKTRRS